MLYQVKDKIYIKANNKFYRVEYKNNELKHTSEVLYSINTDNVVPYQKAIEVLEKGNSKTFKIEKEDK